MNRLKAQNKTHLQWVDHTKLLACVLVVLGHFAQSMVRALLYLCRCELCAEAAVPRRSQYGRGTGAGGLLFPKPAGALLVSTGAVSLFRTDPPCGQKGQLGSDRPGVMYLFHLRSLSCGCTARLCAQRVAKLDLVCHGTGTGQCACRFIAQKVAAAAVGRRILLLAGITFTLLHGNRVLSLLCGLLACGAVLSATQLWHPDTKLCQALNLCSRDTFPIYLLHTICAAPVRSLLLHFGVQNPVMHIALGLAASFLLPMAAGRIAARVPVFNFFLYPTRYILKKQAAPCAAVGEP